jgi:hypothetical protein
MAAATPKVSRHEKLSVARAMVNGVYIYKQSKIGAFRMLLNNTLAAMWMNNDLSREHQAQGRRWEGCNLLWKQVALPSRACLSYIRSKKLKNDC